MESNLLSVKFQDPISYIFLSEYDVPLSHFQFHFEIVPRDQFENIFSPLFDIVGTLLCYITPFLFQHNNSRNNYSLILQIWSDDIGRVTLPFGLVPSREIDEFCVINLSCCILWITFDGYIQGEIL